MLKITKATSTARTTICSKRVPQYIVVHFNVTVAESIKGTAKKVAKSYQTGTKSADFVVDDGSIVQYNPDMTRRYCWSLRDNLATRMQTIEGGIYYGTVTDSNSVHIEMCPNKRDKSTMREIDTDWYFSEATLKNCADTVKYLMDLYNIPITNVVMHHHVTGKLCPSPYCLGDGKLIQWYNFKERVLKLYETEGSYTVSLSNLSLYNDINTNSKIEFPSELQDLIDKCVSMLQKYLTVKCLAVIKDDKNNLWVKCPFGFILADKITKKE